MQNIQDRQITALDGDWHTIVDPFENGFYNHRYEEKDNGYFKNAKPQSPSDRIEYDFDTSPTLKVPGDWNTQRKELYYYEGTIWYKKSFELRAKSNSRHFIYFGAANYHTIVYLNGNKLGEHIGGFTPFEFEITDRIKSGENVLVVKVDNKRKLSAVPTVNTDWWNYGGITRSVYLVETPDTFIRNYRIGLNKNDPTMLEGWVDLDGAQLNDTISLSIEGLKSPLSAKTDKNGRAYFNSKADLKKWSPDTPHLHDLTISSSQDSVQDEIGFRTITTKGKDILLNGKSIFLKGISIHEEAKEGGRAYSEEHARELLGWAKELGANFVRLAHYPHNETMVRMAERMGLMVWSEIPVYWTIQWENKDTFKNAQNQLADMIDRDKNRAAIVMWSVANETPIGDARMSFLTKLIETARSLDGSRLITAALDQVEETPGVRTISDPLGNYIDVIGINEYIGWYDGLPEKAREVSWQNEFDKPLIISEFGGGALAGYHGDPLTRWTEEYQELIYREQIPMLERIDSLRGISPWILKDFRSPRRHLPGIQDDWNRKGLISEKGEKKKAFEVLKNYYERK